MLLLYFQYADNSYDSKDIHLAQFVLKCKVEAYEEDEILEGVVLLYVTFLSPFPLFLFLSLFLSFCHLIGLEIGMYAPTPHSYITVSYVGKGAGNIFIYIFYN